MGVCLDGEEEAGAVGEADGEEGEVRGEEVVVLGEVAQLRGGGG